MSGIIVIFGRKHHIASFLLQKRPNVSNVFTNDQKI